jgi:hypothetical protein
MADKQPVQIRTRKFIRNAVLARRQFVSLLILFAIYFIYPYLRSSLLYKYDLYSHVL